MSAYLRLACLLVISLCLKGCAPMLAIAGYHQTVVQVVAQVERVKLAGDGVSYVASSKTITDHLLSSAVGKDCKVFNVVSRDPVCTDKSADAKVKVSVTAETESTSQPDAQAAPETGTEITTSPIVLSRRVIGD
jgi:hypothetical protein